MVHAPPPGPAQISGSGSSRTRGFAEPDALRGYVLFPILERTPCSGSSIQRHEASARTHVKPREDRDAHPVPGIRLKRLRPRETRTACRQTAARGCETDRSRRKAGRCAGETARSSSRPAGPGKPTVAAAINPQSEMDRQRLLDQAQAEGRPAQQVAPNTARYPPKAAIEIQRRPGLSSDIPRCTASASNPPMPK